MLGLLLVGILIVALCGAVPKWPYSASWGYYPTGGLSLALLIVVVLLFMGRI
jgi:low affinity Fe/Cu permease